MTEAELLPLQADRAAVEEEEFDSYARLWDEAGRDGDARAAISKVAGLMKRDSRSAAAGVRRPPAKKVGGVLASMRRATGRAAVAELPRVQRRCLAMRLAVLVGLADAKGAADLAVQEAALNCIVGCYQTYYVDVEDPDNLAWTFTLTNLLPVKEYASMSTRLLRDLSNHYTTVSAALVLSFAFFAVLTAHPLSVQAPLQRPTVVMDYEDDDGDGVEEYPADVLCIVSIAVPGDAEQEPKDYALIQWYEYALPEQGCHPYVPAAALVYLGSGIDVVPTSSLKRPALLVPLLNPTPAERCPGFERHVSSPEEGNLPRPCYLWCKNIQ